jgi:hypothetical protein
VPGMVGIRGDKYRHKIILKIPSDLVLLQNCQVSGVRRLQFVLSISLNRKSNSPALNIQNRFEVIKEIPKRDNFHHLKMIKLETL